MLRIGRFPHRRWDWGHRMGSKKTAEADFLMRHTGMPVIEINFHFILPNIIYQLSRHLSIQL